MSEKQPVTTDVWEDGPPESRALTVESQLGKAPEGFGSRLSLAAAVPLHICHCCFPLVPGME